MIEGHSDVAKIWCDGTTEVEFGSGLLVAPNLVLTAKHVVEGRPAAGTCRVRLMRHDGTAQAALPADIAWMSDKADLALLEIGEGEHDPHFSYRFCLLEHDEPISSVSMTGFPLATRNELEEAKDYSVVGNLRREGENSISFSVPVPDQPARDTHWQGMSGAAALVPVTGRIRKLFGVVEESRKQFPNGKLYIASARFLNDPGFSAVYLKATKEEPPFLVLGDSPRSKTSAEFPFLNKLYHDLDHLPPGSKSPHAYEIDIARVAGFDATKDIIAGRTESVERISPRLLLPNPDEDYERRLLYLQAPGGYGKSSFLRRLIRSAIDDGFVAFHLDPKGRIPNWSSTELLFQTCTRMGGNFALFAKAALEAKWPVLLVIDGLNESGSEWRTIQARLQELVNNYGQVSIVAADRMNPDRTRPEDFELATVLPIQVAAIPDDRLRELVGRSAVNRLLSVPFFLDKYYAMRAAGDGPDISNFGRADIISAYLCEYAGGKAAGAAGGLIESLSELAVESYRGKSLRIEASALDARISAADRGCLVEAGILVSHSAKAFGFSHQLIHDFLAAKWLANQGSKAWTRDNFDAVTLGAQSFDALELASELLGDRADQFILEVYDWNYKGALECILNLDAGLSGKESPLPPQLKDAVFILRADKLFDRFQSTRDSARAKIADFRSAFGIDPGAMESAAELIDAVRSKYETAGIPLYQDWRDLFTLEQLEPAHWAFIQDSPLLGWTAANVFRRGGFLDGPLTAYLVGLYRALRRSQLEFDGGITARWRIVHTLGGSSAIEATTLLSAAIADEDEDDWVRYGSVRSLVEIASRAGERDGARAILGPLLAGQTLPEKVRREVRGVALLAEDAPPWWPELYKEVLESGMAKLDPTKPDEERERPLWDTRLKALAATGAARA